MEYQVEVNGAPRTVTVRRIEGRFEVAIGDRAWTVDAEPLGTQGLSLLIAAAPTHGDAVPVASAEPGPPVVSHEVAIAAAPGQAGRVLVGLGPTAMPVTVNGRERWRGGGGGGTVADARGPQGITAPMPGRVVRVLAQAGAHVESRQAVVVIEAMKMENELRSPVDGIVSDVRVAEGQSVEAGAVLAVITPQ